MGQLQNTPTELLKQAAQRIENIRGSPIYGGRAHVAFAAVALRRDAWFAAAESVNGYANYTLPDSFFARVLALAVHMDDPVIDPAWTESVLFSPPVLTALALRAPSGVRFFTAESSSAALTAEQRDALVSLIALPLVKNGAKKLDNAAARVLAAYSGSAYAGALACILWHIWQTLRAS